MHPGYPAQAPIDGLTGWHHIHQPSVGSTNQLLIETATQGGAIDRLWWTADQQLGGRGRRGRQWASPPGNMYASVGLLDAAAPQALGTLPLVAAVAAHKAVADALPDARKAACQIKWPNDVLINRAKCAGLLLEAFSHKGATGVVIGFGINCAHAPTDTPYPTATLVAQGATISPHQLWRALADSFAHYLEIWDRGRNFSEIRRIWLANAVGIGEEITVNLASGSKRGIFQTIDDEGFLLLNSANNEAERISAGDVFFQH